MKKVVVFGGGTGISCLLSGLKLFPIDVTAVITVSDNGLVTAVGPGTTYLVVECGAIAKEFKVIVPS